MFKRSNKRKPGAIRKNVLPKKTVPVRLLMRGAAAVVISVVFVFMYRQVASSEWFPVEQVRIEGEFIYLDTVAVKQQIADQTSGGFFDIDIAAIRGQLLEMQWVEDAYVRREWPSSLVIRVVEKEPVARWNDKGVLTSTGQLFYPQVMPTFVNLAQLRGPLGRHAFVLSEYNRIQSQLHEVDIQITKLAQNERRSWTMMVDGVDIQLGRKDINKKIESFAAVYQTLIKPKADKIEHIDFRYTNGFAVKWQQTVTENMSKQKNIHMKQAKLIQDTLLGTV